MCELLSRSRANHPYLAQPCITIALHPHSGQPVLPQEQLCVSSRRGLPTPSWQRAPLYCLLVFAVPSHGQQRFPLKPVVSQKSHSIQPGDIKEGRGCQCPWRPSVSSPYQPLQSWFMRDPLLPLPLRVFLEGLCVWTIINRHSWTFSHTGL